MFGATSQEKAYIAPFVAFMGFLAINEIVGKIFDGVAGSWWMSEPRYWVFPLQTFVCGWLLAKGWKYYDLGRPRGAAWWLGIGVLVLAIWIAPQTVFGAKPRLDGFDPSYFGNSGAAYWTTIALRFARLVVVVPLLEEIFWRGFLLRYLVLVDGRAILRSAVESIDETLHPVQLFRPLIARILRFNQRLHVAIGKSPRPEDHAARSFSDVPFGTFSWLSFGVVTAGFMLEHQPADWPAAIAAGMLYNLVAYRTRSLAACVLAHAITNLLLGIFVMRTGQWGFW